MDPCFYSQRTSSSARLPAELILHILIYLQFHDIVLCRLVCRAFVQLIDSSQKVQYIIAVGFYQQVQGSLSCSLTTAERRELLVDRGSRWFSLCSRAVYAIQLTDASRSVGLVGGIFYTASCSNAPWYTFYNLGSTAGPKPLPVRSWCPPSNGFTAALDFTMDPSQDLLVFLTRDELEPQIHLRTLTGNDPHPLAASSTLSCPKFTSYGRALQVLGDLVMAVLPIEASLHYLALWNWREDRNPSVSVILDLEDACFLSPSDILVTHSRGYMSVFSLGDPCTGSRVLSSRRTFAFPRLKPNFEYECVLVTAYGTASFYPKQGEGDLFPGPPFQPRINDGIVAVDILVCPSQYELGDNLACYILYVRSSALLGLMDSSEPPLDPPAQGILEWTAWGPPITRWFDDDEGLCNSEAHSVHGYRAATAVATTAESDAVRRVVVRDFIPHVQALTNNTMSSRFATFYPTGHEASMVTEPSYIAAANSAFAEDVVSALPYREVSTTVTTTTFDIMIDDSRIVCMNEDANGVVSVEVLAM